MNRPHLMAAVSFAVALVLYLLGLATDYLAGFFLLGMFFEVVAWKNVIDARRARASARRESASAPR
ncbi:hypothetical protein [Massilia cavernae]|uniref:Uncharacterized protein n=1 Tax=Massilia cavernae TaxID=2320864 RepID=A0A418Y805_9BURK|nr:hypothetical protein [Massilia cavernae]RJG27225.1 hypothetical protein D3872_01530 [Massilia cavernae]